MVPGLRLSEFRRDLLLRMGNPETPTCALQSEICNQKGENICILRSVFYINSCGSVIIILLNFLTRRTIKSVVGKVLGGELGVEVFS
jgi:hypothetical protein